MSDAAGPEGERATYVESQVIMTTVRVVAPFAFTYGLFLSFHGGASPGGGFQGGAIVGATVLMIAFAFGIEPTREWLANRVVAGLVAGGVVAFALIGLVPLLVGGRFLEHPVYVLWGDALGVGHAEAYALEAVEIVGITPIVAAAVIGLFFVIAAGVPGIGPARSSGEEAVADEEVATDGAGRAHAGSLAAGPDARDAAGTGADASEGRASGGDRR